MIENLTMPNFYRIQVNETVCRTTANEDNGAIAYVHLSDQHQTPSGLTYENGIARNVTRTNKMALTNCFLRTK